MSSFMTLFIGLEICLLPVLGVAMLIASKVASGRAGAVAERLFFGTLLLATVATFRTLLSGETHWLMHAVTMAVLIVGSVSIPDGGRSKSIASSL